MKEAQRLTRSVEISVRDLQIRGIADALERINRDLPYKRRSVDGARQDLNVRDAEAMAARERLGQAEGQLAATQDGVRVLTQLRERLYGEILLLGGDVELGEEDDA